MPLRVNWRQSVALTGTVVKYLAATMFLPLAVSLVYGEDILVFVASIGITVAIGLGLERLESDVDLGAREAILFVSLAWGVVAMVGTVPYLIAGFGTESTLANPVNALFESMSGFTTTGSTVMGEISFDRHSHALLIWRQLSQWLGGMGIIVLMVAILPEVAVNGAQFIESEAPGPELQKMTPRIVETARLLWLFYIAFTVLYICLLYGLSLAGRVLDMAVAPNMNLYNAVAHGFTTLPTGGFSPQADSIAAFSPAVQWVVIPFMIIAGMNFALFYFILQGDSLSIFRDREFQTYIGAILGLIAILWGLLFTGSAPALELGGQTNGVLENSLRQAAFQIGSLMNSTGYATSDFAQWDAPAKMVLLFTMFIGGSAGSTGGGVKVVRWLVLIKASRRTLYLTVHPETVQPIRLGGHIVDEDAISGIVAFTFLYLFIFAIASVLISLDAGRVGMGLTAFEAISASLATLGNIGPGFGLLGPFGSFLDFPTTSKLLMTVLMWLGRLEVIPVLVLFTGAFWKR